VNEQLNRRAVNAARRLFVIKPMDTFVRDLRYACRSLVKMGGAAVVAILTLALGIGATTTMFSVVYAMLLRPPPFANPDRLVILFNTSVTPRDGLQRLRWSMPNITELERATRSFESVGSFTGPLFTISGRGDPEHVDGETVSRGYFQALRVSPIAGRLFSIEEGAASGSQPVAIISARLWKRMLAGDPSAVGRALIVNDVPLTIVGILPEGFAGLSGKAELWIPPPMAARLYYSEYLTTPQNFISVIARLKDGVSVRQANAELTAIGGRFVGNGSAPETVWGATAVPLQEARVDPMLRQGAVMLFAAAGCVLLVACVNVAGLLLARARIRQREIAVRLAMGAGQRRLVQQLLTEGLLMAILAGVCGTVLAWWGIGIFARTAPAAIASGRNNYAAIGTPGAPSLDAGVLLFALVVALGTTVLFALVPALAASRPDLVTALKCDDRGGGRGGRSLSILVVSEVAIACLLLTASGLLVESFARIQNKRTGFVSDDVLTFWVRPPGSRYPSTSGPATVDRLLSRIQAVPGVESAAVNRCVPFSGCSRTTLFLPNGAVDRMNAPAVGRHYISADYFRTLGIPIITGRTFTEQDREPAPAVAMVNATFARKYFPGQSPLGKRVRFGDSGDDWITVIAVVGDSRNVGLHELPTPLLYLPYHRFPLPFMAFAIRSAAPITTISSLARAVIKNADADLPVDKIQTLGDVLKESVAQPRFRTLLFSAFAFMAVILASVGVYGLISYSVTQRTREIGIRMALGAQTRQVMLPVLREGLTLALGGIAIGLAGSLATSRAQRLSLRHRLNRSADVLPRGAPAAGSRGSGIVYPIAART